MTDKDNRSVAKTFDLSLTDLASAFCQSYHDSTQPLSPLPHLLLFMLLQSWLKLVLAQYPVIIATHHHDKMDITPPDQVSKTEAMARGHEALFVATSDRLSSHPTKDVRATDSCFALITGLQCNNSPP